MGWSGAWYSSLPCSTETCGETTLRKVLAAGLDTPRSPGGTVVVAGGGGVVVKLVVEMMLLLLLLLLVVVFQKPSDLMGNMQQTAVAEQACRGLIRPSPCRLHYTTSTNVAPSSLVDGVALPAEVGGDAGAVGHHSGAHHHPWHHSSPHAHF